VPALRGGARFERAARAGQRRCGVARCSDQVRRGAVRTGARRHGNTIQTPESPPERGVPRLPETKGEIEKGQTWSIGDCRQKVKKKKEKAKGRNKWQ